MWRRADAVVCSTEEQRTEIGRLCANVHVILDVQDSAVRERKREYGLGSTVNLFWEGLPYNLDGFRSLDSVLRELSRERSVAIHLMTLPSFGRWSGRVGRINTADLAARRFDRAYVYQWNAPLLSRVATGCDLAVIPLDLANPFARGKPENKLLLMWRMGLPALVSRTPAYARAMHDAGLEMTCQDEGQWRERLRAYLTDEDARRQAAEQGHAFAVREHSAERIFARWDRVLESVGR